MAISPMEVDESLNILGLEQACVLLFGEHSDEFFLEGNFFLSSFNRVLTTTSEEEKVDIKSNGLQNITCRVLYIL